MSSLHGAPIQWPGHEQSWFCTATSSATANNRKNKLIEETIGVSNSNIDAGIYTKLHIAVDV